MTDKSSRATELGLVRRAYKTTFEVRGKSGSKVEIQGYASVYDELYDMWDFLGLYKERVRPGAGAKTLSESPQVQLMLNHAGLAMAYTKAGTLRLGEDTTGLEFGATVNTLRGDVRDMVTAIEDGDVDETSFAFRVMRQEWSPDYEQRDILEYNLHRGDVSVVNFGANPAGSVEASMRAQDFDHLDEAAARALYERLERRLHPPKPQRSIALIKALAEVQG